MLQDEYYVLESNKDACSFSWDQDRDQFGLGKPVNVTGPVKIRLGEPIADKPKLVDLHEMPAPVISKRIYDVLEPIDIYGIQLIPAKVRNPNSGPLDEPYDYWFLHVWNRIHCLDTDNSELEYSRSGNTIFGIEKLVLDDKKLKFFELHKRKVFELAENTSTLLVHQSIKDIIVSVKPIGCRFYKATEWTSDSSFD